MFVQKLHCLVFWNMTVRLTIFNGNTNVSFSNFWTIFTNFIFFNFSKFLLFLDLNGKFQFFEKYDENSQGLPQRTSDIFAVSNFSKSRTFLKTMDHFNFPVLIREDD